MRKDFASAFLNVSKNLEVAIQALPKMIKENEANFSKEDMAKIRQAMKQTNFNGLSDELNQKRVEFENELKKYT